MESFTRLRTMAFLFGVLFLFLVCVNSLDEDKKSCPKFCNKLYKPVCGISYHLQMKTFSNKCMMEVHSCENNEEWYELCEGECKKKSKKEDD